MVKSDKWWIQNGPNIVKPFVAMQVKEVREGGPLSTAWSNKTRVISFGLSSYGYDCRLAPHFKIFTNVHNSIIDPKNVDPKSFVEIDTEEPVVIPPNSFALSRSLEWFRIPRDIVVLCIGKSTYARCGIVVNVTPLEPEWEGYITIEISNTAPLPARIYPNEGIMQVLFLEGDEACATSYADRAGKYQGQREIVLPRV